MKPTTQEIDAAIAAVRDAHDKLLELARAMHPPGTDVGVMLHANQKTPTRARIGTPEIHTYNFSQAHYTRPTSVSVQYHCVIETAKDRTRQPVRLVSSEKIRDISEC